MTDQPARARRQAATPHPLLARVDWEAAGREAADLLSAYVKIDSSHPRGRTVETADFLEDILRREGIETTPLRDARARQGQPGVAGCAPSSPTGKAIVLSSHMDVVQAVASDWTFDPFSGEVADGYVYGRGALDMKGMGIMELMTVLLLKRQRRRADARRAAAVHLRRGDRQPARREADGRRALRRPRPGVRAGRGRLGHARLLQPGRRLRGLGRREADHLDDDGRPRRARPRLAALGRGAPRTGWSAPPTRSSPSRPRSARPRRSPR